MTFHYILYTTIAAIEPQKAIKCLEDNKIYPIDKIILKEGIADFETQNIEETKLLWKLVEKIPKGDLLRYVNKEQLIGLLVREEIKIQSITKKSIKQILEEALLEANYLSRF